MKYNVPLIAKIFYYTGVVKLYHFGSHNNEVGFVNGVFRTWHPLTWLLYVFIAIPCAFTDMKIQEALPHKLNKFYSKPENLKWITWRDFK